MSYYVGWQLRTSPSPRIEVENGSARFESLFSGPISGRDRKFMESLRDQFDAKGTLSEKQIECLVRTEEKYSPEALVALENWTVRYRSELRQNAIICANYYVTTQYFRDLAISIATQEDFVPTPRQYKAMCDNKYARKAITAATQPPLFEVGALCKVRKNPNTGLAHHNQIGLVVSNHPVGLYASSTLLVNGETVKYEQRLLKQVGHKKRGNLKEEAV